MTRDSADARSRPIEDYAIIGDSRTAGLVSRDGTIDWLCWPRFDSPAVFAGILDPEKGGRWQLRCGNVLQTSRRYEDSSNVLVTHFVTETGEGQLTDLFFAAAEDYKRERPLPRSMLIRRFHCSSGSLKLWTRLDPRPEFGAKRARFTRRGPGSWTFALRDSLVHLVSEMPLSLEEGELRGEIVVPEGDSIAFVLSLNEDEPAIFPPLSQLQELIQVANDYWRDWAAHIGYEGPHKVEVMRSALVLKLLTYAPSGAVVAAPTTSLPEKIGAQYNWDYRFCWLRDASYTINAFLGLGLREEAIAFLQWLLHTTHRTQPRLQIMYSILGKPALPERELEHLSGYRDSKQVRVGNEAHNQVQLDVYGEVINAASLCYEESVDLSGDEKSFLQGLGEFVLDNWRRPDSGIWESRGPEQHYLHSKLMCWVALDRLNTLTGRGLVKFDQFLLESAMTEIEAEISQQGFSEELGSYAATLGGSDLDAAVLRIPILGFEKATAPRMASTIAAIEKGLGRNGFIDRNRSEETGGEGSFLICSFWLVQCLVLQGKVTAAEKLFDQLCSRANDVGLFSEEIDPDTGAFLGNFPQAFTHIGLINAALALQSAGAPKSI